MPSYIFKNPKTNELKEVILTMNESHIYIGKDGTKWDREFTTPQAAFNTQINPTDSHSFIEKTKGKNYSVGQMWDISAELSEKREGASGQDEMRIKAETAYKDKTGKTHPQAKKKSVFEV